MHISEIEQFRLEKAVRAMCSSRNQSILAEMGKVQYEIYSEGVMFSKLCFLLDSSHVNDEFPIAKLEYDSNKNTWQLFLAESEEGSTELEAWVPYPKLQPQSEFARLLDEIELDPHQIIW
ncbi:DUF3024 domain-containing protein [Vibrio sp. DW001]|uniref:DUF3024 domain-containing protein n=1 Tax=unclassified Vibrio TaxID=2614977 RepID=UPI00189F216E|nr:MULTISPECIES: DUF3024 domain-containing protein [unclassified Vibrio]UGA57010.1 DUF3024 domain-containing protein [Vibrio sp. VB16]WED29346.1 DUF3024 domain-containing protein [Vibrio sp. DW001]